MNKWFIAFCSSIGLAGELKRTPQFKIQRARLNMEFKRARQRLEQDESNPRFKELLETLEKEYAQFLATIKEWQTLQMERVQQGKQMVAEGKQKLADRLEANYCELELSLRAQRKRLALITAQLHV